MLHKSEERSKAVAECSYNTCHKPKNNIENDQFKWFPSQKHIAYPVKSFTGQYHIIIFNVPKVIFSKIDNLNLNKKIERNNQKGREK